SRGKYVGKPLPPMVLQAGGAAFSPDCKTLVTVVGGPGGAQLWGAGTGKPLGAPPGPPFSRERALAFGPDRKTALTACCERWAGGKGEVRLWEVASGKPLGPPLPYESHDRYGGTTRVAFSPDGKIFVMVNSRSIVKVVEKTVPIRSLPATVRLYETATG